MRPWLPLLAVLLLALPVHGAPNAREEPLDAGAPVLDVAIAHDAVAGARVKFAVAAKDVASGMTGRVDEPHLETWRSWDRAGDQLRAGDTDRTNCAQRAEDDCVGDTVAIDVSDDGRRMVAVGDIDATTLSLTPSDNVTQAVFVDAQQGIIARYQMDEPVRDAVLSGDGTKAAFLLEVGTTTVTSRLVVVAWPTSSAVEVIKDVAIEADIDGMAIDTKGMQIALWGSAYHQYTVGADESATTSADTRPATEAAISAGTDPLAVVGFEKGTVAVYSKAVSGGDKVPIYSRQPTSSDITAVAITRDGAFFAAGDASGKLHMFRTTTSTSDPAEFLRTFTVGTGAVREVSMSDDRQYMSLRVGREVQFLHWDGASLTPLWKDDLGADGHGLAMDGTGDHLAIAVGEGLRVYDALHLLNTVLVGGKSVAPGETASLKARVQNDGNRFESATLKATGPPGWTVSREPDTVRLAPGGSTEVDLEVQVPRHAPPGTRSLYLNHTLADGSKGEGRLQVTVPEVRGLLLNATGSRSIPIEPGAPAAFQMEARNEGNVRATGGFTVTGPDGWTTAMTPRELDLAPGAKTPVELSIQAPDGLEDGAAGTFTVALADDPASAIELTATAGARFEVALSLPRGFEAGVGNATPFALTVENRGNAIDNVDVAAGPLPSGWTIALPSGLEASPVLDLAPGEVREVQGTLTISPDGVIGERHVIEMTAKSRADPTKTAKDTMLVTIGEAGSVCPEGEKLADDGTCKKERTPGLGLPVLVGTVLVLAMLRRR